MAVFDFIPFFGRDQERRTINLLKEDMALVYESVVELDGLFEAFSAGDEKKAAEKRRVIDELEKRADELLRQIEESLYSGAFLPVSRGRLLDFTEKIDNIADVVQDTAHMTDFISEELRVPEVDEALREHVKKTVACVGHLKEAVDNIDSGEKIKALIREVDKEEHDADLIERRIFHMLYESDHKPKVFLLYSKIIEFAGDISNEAEGASDMLSLILLMHKP